MGKLSSQVKKINPRVHNQLCFIRKYLTHIWAKSCKHTWWTDVFHQQYPNFVLNLNEIQRINWLPTTTSQSKGIFKEKRTRDPFEKWALASSRNQILRNPNYTIKPKSRKRNKKTIWHWRGLRKGLPLLVPSDGWGLRLHDRTLL